VIGGGEVEGGALAIAVELGDLACRDQAGDLGGDRRRRVSSLVFPALVVVDGAMGYQEVGGGANVIGIQLAIAAKPALPRHDQRNACSSGSST
jgi:hypothetical protein